MHLRYAEQKEELLYDFEVAKGNISDWKSHNLRAIHQDKAKEEILGKLGVNQVFVLMDWAMKFLPVKFREAQSEWFGKKGKSWHVSAAITKDPNRDYEVF